MIVKGTAKSGICTLHYGIDTPPVSSTIPDETDLRLSADVNTAADSVECVDLFDLYQRPVIEEVLNVHIGGPLSVVSPVFTASNGFQFVGIAIWRFILAQFDFDPSDLTRFNAYLADPALYAINTPIVTPEWACAINARRTPLNVVVPVTVPHNVSVAGSHEVVPVISRDGTSKLYGPPASQFPGIGSISATVLSVDSAEPADAKQWLNVVSSSVRLSVFRSFLMVPREGVADVALQQEGGTPADGTKAANYAGITQADCDAVRAALTQTIIETSASGLEGTVGIHRLLPDAGRGNAAGLYAGSR